MKNKPIVSRETARRDIEAAIDHYTDEAGPDVAMRFIEALREAYSRISLGPTTGSPRYAHELSIEGLRSAKLQRFPYLIFYIECDDHIDLWRVLHARRDIPSWMNEKDGST